MKQENLGCLDFKELPSNGVSNAMYMPINRVFHSSSNKAIVLRFNDDNRHNKTEI